VGTYPLSDVLICRELNPVELAYGPTWTRWLAQLTASPFNGLGQ